MGQVVRVFMLAGLKDENPNIQPETLRHLLTELLFGEEFRRKVCEYHAIISLFHLHIFLHPAFVLLLMTKHRDF